MEQVPLWPVHPQIHEGELFSSWVVRVAHGNGFKLRAFTVTYFGRDAKLWMQDADRSVSVEVIARLSQRTGVQIGRIEAATLRSMDGVVWDGATSQANVPWLLPLGTRGRKSVRPGLMCCCDCLAEDEVPYLRQNWRMAWSTVCVRHRRPLIDRCWKCDAVIDARRADRRVRSHLAGWVSMATCANCGFDMRRTPQASPAAETAVSRQAQLEGIALHGHTGGLVQDGLHSLLFFAGLRAIAKLVLRQPLAAELQSLSKRTVIEFLPIKQREALMSEVWPLLDGWPVNFVERCSQMRSPYSELTRDGEVLPWWLQAVCEQYLPRTQMRIQPQEVAYFQQLAAKEGMKFSAGLVQRRYGRNLGSFVPQTRYTISPDDVEWLLASIDQEISTATGVERMNLLRDKVMFVAARVLQLSIPKLIRMQVADLEGLLVDDAASEAGVDVYTCSRATLGRWMAWYLPTVRVAFVRGLDPPWVFICMGKSTPMSESYVGMRFGRAVRRAGLERSIESFKVWGCANFPRG